jgi:hypothetical protein
MSRTRKLAALLAAALLVAPALATAAPKPAAPQHIDVVLCLDTSNSMDGLINAAKMKLWDIVNDLAKIKPAPTLRVGLYSYGNTGYNAKDGWVRKELDLTVDLDMVYQKLNALTTNGGQEYVARVSRDAIDQQKWSEDPQALKLIFVAGNEPASQDPTVKMDQVSTLAKDRGIIINPIYCGGADDKDGTSWRQLAALAGGRFANIDQNGGAVAIATPHDKELAELSTRLNTTMVVYGGEKAKEAQLNQVAQDANALKQGIAAAAARSQTKGGGLYCTSDWDLVDRCKRDANFDITKVPEDQLSDEMKKMKPEERVAHVKKKMAERDALQKQIDDLGNKRQAYIAEELKKNKSAGDKAFDASIRATIREQAAQKGIQIPE